MRSSAPALKFSANTSKWGASASTSSRPASFLRSTVDALLRQVVAQEGGADEATLGVDHARLRSPPRLARGSLDLHHVGTEARQELRRVRQRLHLLEREHAHAVERLPVLRRFLVRHVAELAPSPLRRRPRAGYSEPHLTPRQNCWRARYPRAMRGILSWSAYLPYRRLDRTQIAPFVGQGGGKGTRTVASFDEDPTTMAVEAARLALRGRDLVPRAAPLRHHVPRLRRPHQRHRRPRRAAAARHRCPRSTSAPSVRSAVGALLLALTGAADPTLVVAGDVRTGLPGSGEEAAGGDAATAFVVGSDAAGPVVAEFVGSASVTDEFVERWRAPGEQRTKIWDEQVQRDQLRAARRAGLERGARPRPASPPTTSRPRLSSPRRPAGRRVGRWEARRRRT